jgi:hypothetical protein
MAISIQEDVKNLLKYLHAMSPAYNGLVQMLFILPQKVKALMNMYPELMENEDELIKLFSLRYSSDGFVETCNYPNPLGFHLAGLYHSVFKVLMDANMRSRLLKLANIREDEFREFDPLRAWIDISLQYLGKVDKDALKLLDVVVAKLSGKRPDESISWDEVKSSAKDVKDVETSRSILKHLFLLPYESDYWIYGRECPFLLETYSDLRDKLKELLR